MNKIAVAFFAAGVAAVAFGTSFPEPVGGTVTIDISSDTTYDEAISSDVTKLIKKGTGTAILTVDSTDFTGAVDIQQGTLQINTLGALGAPIGGTGASQITVSATDGAATFHVYKPTVSTASSQSTLYYSDHNITITGSGVGGKGAFIYTPFNTSNYDCFFDAIALSGDATIGVPSGRWGIRNAITLNNHVLTRVGTGTFINFTTATVNGGKFINTEGLYTMQTKPNFTEPTKTSIFMQGGELRFWRTGTVNVPVTFVSGTAMRSGANNSSAAALLNENRYDGGLTVDLYRVSSGQIITNRVYADVDDKTWMTYSCPLVLKTALRKTMPGTLYIKGDVLGSRTDVNAIIETYSVGSAGTSYSNSGLIRFEGDHERTFYILQTLTRGDILMDDGTMTLRDLNLQGTGGRFFLEGGTVKVNGMIRAGQAGGNNVIRMTGGTITNTVGDCPHYGVRVNSSGVLSMGAGEFQTPNGHRYGFDKGCWGMLVQKGGIIRVSDRASPTEIGCRGDAFAFVGGGTNDTYHSQYSYNTMKLSEGGGKSQLVISGEKTRFETDMMVVGCTTNSATNVIALVNGGSLRAMRLYRVPNAYSGSHFSMVADGGVLMPTWTSGWCHKDPTNAEFIPRAPDKFTIFSGGLTIDTSECCGDDRKTGGSSDLNFAFSAPTGKRIASITLPNSEAFLKESFYSEKMLEIVGPEGSFGACAYVDFDYDTGALGEAKLLCGGCNYDETTKIYIRSANLKTQYECTYTLADQLAGGDLVKQGTNNVSLWRANTYAGATRILEGRITVNADGVIPANTKLEIAKGAALNMQSRALTLTALSGEGNVYNCTGTTLNGPVKITLSELFADNATPLTVSGDITFGTGSSELEITDREDLEDYAGKGAKVFLKANSFKGTIPQFVKQAGESDGWRVIQRGNKLYFGQPAGFIILVQ